MRAEYHPSFKVVVDGPLSKSDFFDIDKVTYRALPLDNNDPKKGCGVNATILRAVLADGSSADELILKVSNFPEHSANERAVRRRDRFEREIRAYAEVAKSNQEQWVLDYYGDGYVSINSKNGLQRHRCFLVEKADYTLLDYLRNELDITLQQRLLLCYDILRAFTALHGIGIYHRDIKPENLFLVSGTLKIGDLGLVMFRADDSTIDGTYEAVGPRYWMAPEAVNKVLCLEREECGFINRTVSAMGDAYQIGKLFWYIIQGDVPNGIVRSADLRVAGTDVFGALLKPLLHYDGKERPALSELMSRMEPLRRRYGF